VHDLQTVFVPKNGTLPIASSNNFAIQLDRYSLRLQFKKLNQIRQRDSLFALLNFSAIANAQAFLNVRREFGSFDKYVWQFVNGKPIKRKHGQPVLAKTDISDALSKDLIKRDFRFVGSTICYAFMQAVGMVNDHDWNCFRYRQL
jgi:3-methyladenine DNA glycosylase Tag